MAIALNLDQEFDSIFAERYKVDDSLDSGTKKYLETERENGKDRLKLLSNFRLAKTVQTSLSTNKELNQGSVFSDEELALLKNPERYTRLDPQTTECYYRMEIPGLNGLELHILGEIYINEESEGNTPRPEDVYLFAKAIVIGKPGIGYINILEGNTRGVDISVGKIQSVDNDENYILNNGRIRVGEINSVRNLYSLFHELGHYVDRNYILNTADKARRLVLRRLKKELGNIDRLKRIGDKRKIKDFITERIDSQIVFLKFIGKVDIIELDWDEKVRSLADLDVEDLESEISAVVVDEERFASIYGLSVSESIARIFDLPGRFVDEAYEVYEDNWRTYDLGKLGRGTSVGVRKYRSEQGELYDREQIFVHQTDRLKSNISKVFPDLSASAPLNKFTFDVLLDGNKGSGNVYYDNGKSSPDRFTFAISLKDQFVYIVFSPADKSVLFRGKIKDEKFMLTTGDINALSDTSSYEKVISSIDSINRVLEGSKPDTTLEFSMLESQLKALQGMFSNNPLVSSFSSLSDSDIGKDFNIDGSVVNPIHRLHVLTSFIKLAFEKRFPDLKVPNFDENTGERMSLDYFEIIKHYAREFLIHSGIKEIPRVNSWNSELTFFYIKVAANYLNPQNPVKQ